MLFAVSCSAAKADQRFDIVASVPTAVTNPQNNIGLGLAYKFVKVGPLALAGQFNATYKQNGSPVIFVAPGARVSLDLGRYFDIGVGAVQVPYSPYAFNSNNYQTTASIGLKL